ncbi:MAG: helix-turn-helix domain-containing protein [Clostridia bacterium]|nr:helix-turn-helix domain-containing protein [Clostridia bacterium]
MATKERIREKRVPREFLSYDELPEFMTVNDVADVLRISVASAYTLTEQEGFPLLLLNCQRRVKKESFIEWLKGRERKPNA